MSITRLSPAEAQKKMSEGYTFVDVRSVEEFDEGHPAGAVNIPYLLRGPQGMVENHDFLSVMQGAFPPGAKVVLGCRSGNRSMRAAELMVVAGYADLCELRPGWDGSRDAFGQVTEPGWSRAGLAVATAAAPGASYHELKSKAGA